MKVLKRKERPTAIVNCPYCGGTLEIENSDIFWYKEIDGGSVPCVTCAICHKDMMLIFMKTLIDNLKCRIG